MTLPLFSTRDDSALTLRLEASQTAQERSRLSFFATTIIALAMVTGAWNAYLSFYRDVAYEFSNLHQATPGHNREGTQALQKELLAAWVKSRMINVSLLGINVGVDDVSTVGAVALMVALIWFYFAIRRENHTIGWLLLDYHNSPAQVRWLVFHGINSYTVFSNVGHSDQPINSINDYPLEKRVETLRILSSVLYYLPFAALSFLVALEWLSLIRTSPFRPPFDKSVIRLLWEGQHSFEIASIIFWRVISVVLAVPVFLLCRKITEFDRATENIMRTFIAELKLEGQWMVETSELDSAFVGTTYEFNGRKVTRTTKGPIAETWIAEYRIMPPDGFAKPMRCELRPQEGVSLAGVLDFEGGKLKLRHSIGPLKEKERLDGFVPQPGVSADTLVLIRNEPERQN